MTDKERQELRDWSARLLGAWSDDYAGQGAYFIQHPTDKRFRKLLSLHKDWAPDLPESPTWQIMSVVKRMRELGWYCKILNNVFLDFKPHFVCEFFNGEGIRVGNEADTLQLAILLAAKATGVVE